jgi:hypothetical protein
MLEVYIDRTMIASFVNGVKKSRKEMDISKLNRLIKAEAFIKKGCKLTLDADIQSQAGQVLSYFTQGLGNNEKPSFNSLNTKTLTKNKWSVALLNSDSEIFEEISKSLFTISKDNLWDQLYALLFIGPGQSTDFPIIPEGLSSQKINSTALKSFKGWSTFTTHSLVPLTDAIIIDPYFLRPEAFKDSYNDYNVSAYVEYSLLPLMKLLSKYALNNQLTLNIFTEYHEECSEIAQELFDYLNQSIIDNQLNIKFLLVVPKYLNQHKRILYSNYFALRSELSFYHFQNEKVSGYKKDEVSIKPYAVDNLSNDPHATMLDDLADFYHVIQKPNTQFYGDRTNLSNMIQQAFNHLNQNKS